jgi:hypothetical protein
LPGNNEQQPDFQQDVYERYQERTKAVVYMPAFHKGVEQIGKPADDPEPDQQ